MILPGSFSRDWIERFRQVKEFSKINPPVLEKMIHALALLETLKLAGMNFIFKGGSSLILLLEKTRRFSVDMKLENHDLKNYGMGLRNSKIFLLPVFLE